MMVAQQQQLALKAMVPDSIIFPEESTPCSGQATLLKSGSSQEPQSPRTSLLPTKTQALTPHSGVHRQRHSPDQAAILTHTSRTTTSFSTQLSADSGVDRYGTTALALHLSRPAISTSLRIHQYSQTRSGSLTRSRSTKTMKQQDQINRIRL